MGRDLHYRPGSFYRTDDRTGFPQRAERTKKQWDGLIVDEKVWEPRQPQDLVRGVKDDQTVPEARPLGANVFVGPTFLTLGAFAAPHQKNITLTDTTGLFPGANLGVVLDSGDVFRSALNMSPITTLTVGLSKNLPSGASSGNTVYNLTEEIQEGVVD